jgi:hypothetical protein
MCSVGHLLCWLLLPEAIIDWTNRQEAFITNMASLCRFLCLAVLVFVLFLSYEPQHVEAGSVAAGCKWLGDHTGYYCDGPIARKVWRIYQKIFHGAKDCNSFCKSQRLSGGQCKNVHNYDKSSWCKTGETCICRK